MENEIIQLINITWYNSGSKSLKKSFISRFWSIDMQWLNFSESEKLIDKLIKNGWLIEFENQIKPNIKLDFNKIKTGWILQKTLFENIKNNKKDVESISKPNNNVVVKNNLNQIKNNFSSMERRLLRYISANTGIIKEEIYRRCLRKKRSLGQVTIHLCLLLVAKEQGMDIDELIES